jgi:hypothetical protein
MPAIMQPNGPTTAQGDAAPAPEFELEPEALVALLRPNETAPCDSTQSTGVEESCGTASAVAAEKSAVRAVTRSAVAWERRRWYAARIALPLGALMTVAMAGMVVHGSLSPTSPLRTRVPPITRSAVVVAPAPPATVPTPVPVRFANPFDRHEVFEFPPGTSRAEARSAVAVILMDRARARVRPIARERVATVHRKRSTAS